MVVYIRSSPSNQKNTTNEGWVMVSWMQVWGSNMVGALIWELVYQRWIHRQEINIMHGNIVTVYTRLQEAHVEQRGSVKAKVVDLKIFSVKITEVIAKEKLFTP